MEHESPRVGKFILIFAGLCLLALPVIVLSVFSTDAEQPEPPVIQEQHHDFDQNGKRVFDSYERIATDYLMGTSTERTLAEYYSRRQYLGSPPFIPHKLEDPENARLTCLACHAKGGWTEEMKRHTPITPHPEQEACRQCHVPQGDMAPFVGHDWFSTRTPRLGRAYLPGAPPPIPHSLQMRGDCIACHVGPGAVTAIRVDHPSRGNCRQCHVPDLNETLFNRKSE